MATKKTNKNSPSGKAVKENKQLNNGTPDDAEEYFNLAVAYYEGGLFGESAKYFKKALKIETYDPYICFNLGMAYNELEEYTKAIEAFKKAISLGYNGADIHYSLGAAYGPHRRSRFSIQGIESSKRHR